MYFNNHYFLIPVPRDGSEYPFRRADQIALSIVNKFNSKLTFLYVSLFLSFTNGYINLSGFITPKQTDTLVRYAKEEGNKWFTKI